MSIGRGVRPCSKWGSHVLLTALPPKSEMGSSSVPCQQSVQGALVMLNWNEQSASWMSEVQGLHARPPQGTPESPWGEGGLQKVGSCGGMGETREHFFWRMELSDALVAARLPLWPAKVLGHQ